MAKASELLMQSAEPFDKACMMVREMEQQLTEAKAEIERLQAHNAMLVGTFADVLRISDRKHEAWDAAKAALFATSEFTKQFLDGVKAQARAEALKEKDYYRPIKE